MDPIHLQQVSSSPRSLAAVIIVLKEALSNAPSMSRKVPNAISIFQTLPVYELPVIELLPWTYLPYRQTGSDEVVFQPEHLP
jgi:hypothetical protein